MRQSEQRMIMAQNEVVLHTIEHGGVVGKIVEKKAQDGRVFPNVRIFRPYHGDNGPGTTNLYRKVELLYLLQVVQEAYSWIHANGRTASNVVITDESELD